MAHPQLGAGRNSRIKKNSPSMTPPPPTTTQANNCHQKRKTCNGGPIQPQPSQVRTTAAASDGPNGRELSRYTIACTTAKTRAGKAETKKDRTTGCQPRKAPAIIIRSASPKP